MNEDIKEVAEQMKELLEAMFDLMTDRNFTKKLAKFNWLFYGDLLDEGFTTEQAIQIVTNFNIGGKK